MVRIHEKEYHRGGSFTYIELQRSVEGPPGVFSWILITLAYEEIIWDHRKNYLKKLDVTVFGTHQDSEIGDVSTNKKEKHQYSWEYG